MGVSSIRGTITGDPYNKDHCILGSILGAPYFGKARKYVGCFWDGQHEQTWKVESMVAARLRATRGNLSPNLSPKSLTPKL